MSTIITILNGLSAILPPYRGSKTDDQPSGANAVRTAVTEIESVRDRTFTATLGEPDIVENYGQFFTDPKVVIPINNSPFESCDKVVFDVPEGRDDDYSAFNQLLELFDVELEELEDLAGEEVPMSFFGGNASVMWDDVNDDTDNGEEEEETGAETDENMKADDSESSVNVEETTISAAGDDD